MMKYIRRFLRQDRDYFANNQADIQQQNYSVLRIACILYFLILAVFTSITLIEGRSQTLAGMYFFYDALHVGLCILVFSRAAQTPGDYRRMAACRICFEITILSFFLLEAVIPYPKQQSIYFPFPLILLVILFIDRPGKVLVQIWVYVAAFVALVCLFKDPAVRLNDVYIAAGTLISALIGYVIVAKLRHETAEGMGRLKYLSTTDTMTGLYNKITFESLCRAYLEDESKTKGFALLFFDVDNFKQINDSYGHPFGDMVLKGIASLMRNLFYEKDYLCRYGGDEFVVFMVDIENEKSVKERMKSFNGALSALASTLQIQSLSCSVGVALRASRPETYGELLSRADTALYVAKKSGKKQVNIAETELVETMTQPAGKKNLDPGDKDGSLRRVLVVEDNALNRRLLCTILSRSFEVLEAENGRDALELLRRRYKDISAVLLDIVMPVMDGYELLKQIRDDRRMSSMPVIVTTGYGEEDVEIRALALGANDFVVKPYRPAILMHRLKNTIDLQESSARLSQNLDDAE